MRHSLSWRLGSVVLEGGTVGPTRRSGVSGGVSAARSADDRVHRGRHDLARAGGQGPGACDIGSTSARVGLGTIESAARDVCGGAGVDWRSTGVLADSPAGVRSARLTYLGSAPEAGTCFRGPQHREKSCGPGFKKLTDDWIDEMRMSERCHVATLRD